MSALEMQALANCLNQWGVSDKPVGTAGAGEIDVLVAGEMRDYCLHIGEPVVLEHEPVKAGL